MKKVTKDIQANLIPVYTNLRHILNDNHIYEKYQFASLLASVAHAFSSRISACIISLDNTVEFIGPHGSHPRLNSNYTSSDMQIRSFTERFSRLDKVKIISEWQVALDNMRVCWDMNEIPTGQLNCGKCPKCVRTMAELLAIGKLEEASTFPGDGLKAEMFDRIRISPITIEYFSELIKPLRQIGRNDLANAICKKLDEYTSLSKSSPKNWRRNLRDLDRRYTRGILARLNHLIRGS